MKGLTALRDQIAAVCRDQIYPHVFAASDREVGGFLLGEIQPHCSLPTVRRAVAALGALEERGSLTFTSESWAHLYSAMEEEANRGAGSRELDITGWYHSHPGIGVYLSERDLFIHREFFSARHQIAIVIDPIEAQEGIFIRREQEIELAAQRTIPAEEVSRATAEDSSPQ